ncbi:MAG TPA: Hpt domain-containing protein [Novosphingobium sp.]
MAYEVGAFDATLAAAAGDDPALLSELRTAFIDSFDRQIDLLGRSRCDGNWRVAAMRLKGLAASFNVGPLMVLAEQALDAAPGDPVVIRRLQALLSEFSTA